MSDRYALELERAAAVWKMTGSEQDCFAPVANALRLSLAGSTRFYIPAHFEALFAQSGDAGDAYIPLMTSEAQLRGKKTSCELVTLRDVRALLDTRPSCPGLVLNPFGEMVKLPRNSLAEAARCQPRSVMLPVRASVLDVQASAIVNAANTSLLGGGGVDGAIHRAAGPQLLAECRTLGGCRTGEARVTGAYHITSADCIIHTVGPVYMGASHSAGLLASCYRNVLDLAYNRACLSVAFPGISTGVYGYPLREAAQVAIKAIGAWFAAHPDSVMTVYLCCFREEEYAVYREQFSRQ